MLPLLAMLITAPKWELTFSQEFNGPAGQPVDQKIWTQETGANGYGNAEWETYTAGNKNAQLDGHGNLVIEARKEGEKLFTSARMNTKKSFTQTCGRFEARMKLPVGKGIWPAFWMLGADDAHVGWPACGEIDIMEYLGHKPNDVYGTIHGPGYSGASSIGKSYESKSALNDGFHVYAVEWAPEVIRWYLDDHLYHTETAENLKAKNWVFDHPFYIILNLAVGGAWPGYPDATTQFPQRLVVDYVRAYKDPNLKVDEAKLESNRQARLKKYTEYKGPTLFNLPGTIPAVGYVAYKDNDKENQGGEYRPKEGVDIGLSGKSNPKYEVGYTSAGEWLAYNVNSPGGNFVAEVEVASGGQGGVFHLEIDRKPVATRLQIPDTGGWQSWKQVRSRLFQIPKGRHELRISFDQNGPSGSVGNVTQIRIRAGSLGA